MAANYTGQTCECGGKLVYDKANKWWVCTYCGETHVRELSFKKEQIDGFAGINDLVRSTLSKVIALDFQGAERDLSDCERLNHMHVGTMIAGVALYLFKSFYVKDRATEMGKANNWLQKLGREFPHPEEDEFLLYAFIKSSDIYGLLTFVYAATGQKERESIVYNEHLECSEIFNPNVSRFLMNTLLKEGKIEDVDVLVKKVSSENSKLAIALLLPGYPSSQKKAEHITRLLEIGKPSETDMSKQFDSYFQTTQDDAKVQVDIFISAVKNKVTFNVATVIGSVFKQCNDKELAKTVFDAISAQRMSSEATELILEWCLLACEDAEIAQVGLKSLFTSNSLFEIEDDTVIALLKAELPDEVQAAKLKSLLSIFKISNKNVDRLIAYHLLENSGSFEYRASIFEDLVSRVSSVQLGVMEKYVLNSTMDGAEKPKMVELIFKHSKNLGLCSGLFSDYLKSRTDSPQTREAMIAKFLDYKFVPDASAYSTYLLNDRELHSDALLKRLATFRIRPLPSTFNSYLTNLSDCKKYNLLIADLATQGGFTISGTCFAKYILRISEPESKKVMHAQKYRSACNDNIRDMEFTVNVLGDQLTTNLAQAYMLTSLDDPYVIQEVVRMLQKDKIKLDDTVINLTDRKKIKFKKYVEANQDALGSKIKLLADELL